MTEEYLFSLILQLVCGVTAEEGCVDSVYGITEDVWLEVCCPKL